MFLYRNLETVAETKDTSGHSDQMERFSNTKSIDSHFSPNVPEGTITTNHSNEITIGTRHLGSHSASYFRSSADNDNRFSFCDIRIT